VADFVVGCLGEIIGAAFLFVRLHLHRRYRARQDKWQCSFGAAFGPTFLSFQPREHR
jgi:hypothetical protein